MSSIIRAIELGHQWANERNKPTIYWAIDIHGTVFTSTYQAGKAAKTFYPYALECLQYLSKDKNNVLIMYTSSWPANIPEYMNMFREKEIIFEYVNCNPEVQTDVNGHNYYFSKFYYNVMLEDKAGFDTQTDWKEILDYMKARNER